MLLEKKTGELHTVLRFDNSAQARRIGSMLHRGRTFAPTEHTNCSEATKALTAMVEFPLIGDPFLHLADAQQVALLLLTLSHAMESLRGLYQQDRLSEETLCEINLTAQLIPALARFSKKAKGYIDRQLERLSDRRREAHGG